MGTLKDTPIPGSYHIRDFIEEAGLNPVRRTYGFKETPRCRCVRGTCCCREPIASLTPPRRPSNARPPTPLRAAPAQKTTLWVSATRNRPFTMPLQCDPETSAQDTLQYHTTGLASSLQHLFSSRTTLSLFSPCRHVMFRSAVQRASFLPREGPAPGHYNMRTGPTIGVTSCFRSTVPRLHSVRSRTPGPGTYEPSWQMGHRLGTEANMGRAHGLFFRNVF
ncbi:unnamed protein product [Oncorhynchus mykiss]|uniref:Uncharacterized protein n=1 Tax=Oncorhynchus mykiss TaxID=8022 RepID=A0A060W819_ONCMY|nr:unnamed protein product [Oncorhynchus mykiss]